MTSINLKLLFIINDFISATLRRNWETFAHYDALCDLEVGLCKIYETRPLIQLIKICFKHNKLSFRACIILGS